MAATSRGPRGGRGGSRDRQKWPAGRNALHAPRGHTAHTRSRARVPCEFVSVCVTGQPSVFGPSHVSSRRCDATCHHSAPLSLCCSCVVCVCALFSLSLHSIKPDNRHKRRFGCSTPQYKTRSSFPHRDFERHLTCGSSTPSECAQHHRHTHQLQHQRSSRQKWWWCFLCALRERGLDAFERERERDSTFEKRHHHP